MFVGDAFLLQLVAESREQGAKLQKRTNTTQESLGGAG